MTEKQENILNAALKLFALEGYKSTSTSKVAKLAGVSEGLIFRHFTNKEGLLEAIIQEGEIQAKRLFEDIVLENDPKKVIEKTLDMPGQMTSDKEASDFWKLQYKIKWELEQYGAHKMEPMEQALTRAFSALAYDQPELEARLLLLTLDGLAMRYYLQQEYDFRPVIDYLKTKYGI